MYRVANLLLLIRVSFPFLYIFFSYINLKKEKGPLFRSLRMIFNEAPQLEHLTTAHHKRIYHYIFANSLTTQWFSTLLGHQVSSQEKMTGYYLATATPLADYLVDQEKMNVSEIRNMIDGQSTHPWQNLTKTLFDRSLQCHPDYDLGKDLIFKTLQAQQDSLFQQNGNLSSNHLKKITWAKGGYALLLYRSALSPPISEKEWKAMYQLGGLMQLHNDIFDLFRDIQEGIRTIPTQTKCVDELINLFKDEIDLTYRLFKELPYSSYRKRKFFLLLTLAVHTGFICLDQYKELEEKYQEFKPYDLTRKELICDMDNFGKIAKNICSTINKHHV